MMVWYLGYSIAIKTLITLVLSTVYKQRKRPAVRVGLCFAHAVRLHALSLGHQAVSFPYDAVAAAVITMFCRQISPLKFNSPKR